MAHSVRLGRRTKMGGSRRNPSLDAAGTEIPISDAPAQVKGVG